MDIKLKERLINVINAISVVGGIIIAIWLLGQLYMSQPVGSDFKQLYDIEANYVDGNLEYLKNLENAQVTISADEITVKIENKKCLLVTHFDRELNYLSTTTKSTVQNTFEVILISAACGVIGGFVILIVLAILLFVLEFFVKVWKFIKKRFPKRQKGNKQTEEK